MRCAACDKELGDDPETAVLNDEIEQVIEHQYRLPESDRPFVSQRDFYCSPDCFTESVIAGDDDD